MTKSNLKQATYKCFKLQSPKEAKHSIKPEHRNAFLCENTSWAGNFEFLVESMEYKTSSVSFFKILLFSC